MLWILYILSLQLSMWSPITGKWSVPATTGDIPPPCSDFTFTAIDSHRAVFFAGRVPKLPGNDDNLQVCVDDALAVDDAIVLDYKSWVNSSIGVRTHQPYVL